ncbi:hypothetical protein [Nocardia terpenica]|uniref:HNH endonuclease n=1 Tax=Nocardia terpenica TaxID=455432 RepID=A0A291RC48_9NOCA|nr:hypothetical protein [Nocardia terpenica]ATL65113.1 hypothetical protein CRH09_01580 [Nocardia terpenica]
MNSDLRATAELLESAAIGSVRMAERVGRLARQLLANPPGTPMHRLGMELSAVAEGRPCPRGGVWTAENFPEPK